MMNKEWAVDALLRHAGFCENATNPGLLAKLRPFSGGSESDFAQIMTALVLLHHDLQQEYIERRLICATWWICSQIRLIALSANSPLHRDGKLLSDDRLRLEAWVDTIERFALHCTFGLDIEICLFSLLEYIASDTCISPRHFMTLREAICQCTEYDDSDVSHAAVAALRVMST